MGKMEYFHLESQDEDVRSISLGISSRDACDFLDKNPSQLPNAPRTETTRSLFSHI